MADNSKNTDIPQEAPMDSEAATLVAVDPEDETAISLDREIQDDATRQASSNENTPFQKTRKGQVFILAGLVVLLVVVVVAVVVPSSKKDKQSSESSSPDGWMPGDFGPEYQKRVAMLSPLFPLNQKNIPTSELQENALRWLTFDDTYPPSADLTMPANQLLERFVMAVFYNATDGATWVQPQDFLQATSICEWGEQTVTGIDTSNRNLVQLLCNDKDLLETFVVDTQITSMHGRLPTELGLLTNLKVLRLSNSKDLTGPIPTDLGMLKGLTELKLQGNTLTGTIPKEITGLTFVTLFDLSLNQNLTGPIPPDLKDLLNVETLWLSKYETESDRIVHFSICFSRILTYPSHFL